MEKLHPMMEKAWDETVPLPKLVSILIVDDHQFDRQRMRRLCGQLDFDTYLVEAEDLQSMGTALDRDKFDLVILDYSLPDGNGLHAVSAIKKHSAHRRAAIIMVTGQEQAEIAIEAMKRGCSDYIDKNVLSVESLRRASVNALQKSALSAGIETQELLRIRVEKVLQHFTQECVLEIKPMLSRMMRQLRQLGDNAGTFNAQTHGELETSCMRLWEFLTDLEGFDGKDIVAQNILNADELAPVPRNASSAPNGPIPASPKQPHESEVRPKRPITKTGRLFSKYSPSAQGPAQRSKNV
jgi:DNA-binding NarL/FixJ family response regulator